MTNQLTTSEITKAEEYLASTRDHLVCSIAGLTSQQWHFKPSDEAWSIAEIMEHIVVVEERIHALLAGMKNAPKCDPNHRTAEIEAEILAKLLNRSIKVRGPADLMPLNRWPHEEALERFLTARASTVKLLNDAACLRGHVIPHPLLGPWDGYQWILAAGAHGARHTAQIEEVKTALPCATCS